MQIMRSTALLILLILTLSLSGAERWAYVSGYTTSSTTTASLSITLASTDTRAAYGLAATVNCPDAACTVTFKRGGAISGGSDIAENQPTGTRNGVTLPIAQADAKSGVTVTGGTSLPCGQPVSTGTTPFELEDVAIVAGESLSMEVTTGTSQNITSIIKWEEI